MFCPSSIYMRARSGHYGDAIPGTPGTASRVRSMNDSHRSEGSILHADVDVGDKGCDTTFIASSDSEQDGGEHWRHPYRNHPRDSAATEIKCDTNFAIGSLHKSCDIQRDAADVCGDHLSSLGCGSAPNDASFDSPQNSAYFASSLLLPEALSSSQATRPDGRASGLSPQMTNQVFQAPSANLSAEPAIPVFDLETPSFELALSPPEPPNRPPAELLAAWDQSDDALAPAGVLPCSRLPSPAWACEALAPCSRLPSPAGGCEVPVFREELAAPQLNEVQTALVRELAGGSGRYDPSRDPRASREQFKHAHLVDVAKLKFAHSSISPRFMNGRHRHRTVLSLLDDFHSSAVEPRHLPPLLVMKAPAGLEVICGNRRLYCLKRYAHEANKAVDVWCVVYDLKAQDTPRNLVMKYILAKTSQDGGSITWRQS